MRSMFAFRCMLAGACFSFFNAAPTVAGRDSNGPERHPLESSLEFRVNDAFRFTDLVGVSVSWKGYQGDRGGWRFGLTPELQEKDEVAPDRNLRYRKRSLVIEGQRLGFIDVRSVARICLGLGVMGGIGRESEGLGTGEVGAFHDNRTITSYEAGLIGTVGIERCIAERVVLGIEYGANAVWARQRLYAILWDGEMSDFVVEKKWKSDYRVELRRVAVTIGLFF
jgi:hypothetical protein